MISISLTKIGSCVPPKNCCITFLGGLVTNALTLSHISSSHSIVVDMFNCYISFFPFWRKVAEVLKMRFMHWEKHIWLCAIQNIHRPILFCTIINPLFILREAGWLHKKTGNDFFLAFLHKVFGKRNAIWNVQELLPPIFFARHIYLVRCRSTRLARPTNQWYIC